MTNRRLKRDATTGPEQRAHALRILIGPLKFKAVLTTAVRKIHEDHSRRHHSRARHDGRGPCSDVAVFQRCRRLRAGVAELQLHTSPSTAADGDGAGRADLPGYDVLEWHYLSGSGGTGR
jgi:hypothetical protein